MTTLVKLDIITGQILNWAFGA